MASPTRTFILKYIQRSQRGPQTLVFTFNKRFLHILPPAVRRDQKVPSQPQHVCRHHLCLAPVALFSSAQLLREKVEKEGGTPSLAQEVMSAKLVSKEEEKQGQEKEKAGGKKEMPRWQKIGYTVFAVSFGGLLVGNSILFSLPDKDEHGNDIEDEFSSLPFPSQYYRRLKNKIFTTKKAIEEPFSDKLLPDPLEPPYHQPKYTVILELTGLLVNSDWTHKHGWRFQKRPGLDIFLAQIGYPNFEVVVWTVENAMTFYPIINGMDPQNQYIMYRLFRDATRFKNGTHTKDLYSLNRDLKKVIVIDWNEKTTAETPENSLVLPKWTGENSDRALISLAQFLQEIKDSDVEDVREVLSYYKQFDDPIEAFRENQRKLEENMRIEEERKLKEKETSRFSSFGLSSLSRFRR